MSPATEIQTEPVEQRSVRDEILDAAERLFAERGLAGVSMRDIVAGTSLKNQASLYHHFRNKLTLYQAVLSRGLDHIISIVPAQPTQSIDELNANLDKLLDYLSTHPHLARLIQRAALDDSRYLEKTINTLLRPFYAQASRSLAGADQTWTRNEVPHLGAGLYLLIWGYFANAPLLSVILNEDPLSNEAMKRQRQFVKRAVARLLGLESGR